MLPLSLLSGCRQESGVNLCYTEKSLRKHRLSHYCKTHFSHYFLILSHFNFIPLVRTFGTDRVGEDDVLLEKQVLPCHISAPERSNTNMQSNQRQTVPVMSFN